LDLKKILQKRGGGSARTEEKKVGVDMRVRYADAEVKSRRARPEPVKKKGKKKKIKPLKSWTKKRVLDMDYWEASREKEKRMGKK